jgi:hypothetical protein
LFLVGFFVPNAKGLKGDKDSDLDYFKKLLSENRKRHGCVFKEFELTST